MATKLVLAMAQRDGDDTLSCADAARRLLFTVAVLAQALLPNLDTEAH